MEVEEGDKIALHLAWDESSCSLLSLLLDGRFAVDAILEVAMGKRIMWVREAL